LLGADLARALACRAQQGESGVAPAIIQKPSHRAERRLRARLSATDQLERQVLG
jgi:hypothetical protein